MDKTVLHFQMSSGTIEAKFDFEGDPCLVVGYSSSKSLSCEGWIHICMFFESVTCGAIGSLQYTIASNLDDSLTNNLTMKVGLSNSNPFW
jgi:hypothetical protein